MIFTQINSRRYYASRSTDWLLCPVLDVPTDFSRKFLCGGTTAGEIAAVKRMYGPNKIEVPSRGWLKILLIQLCSPFFIFQYFSVILWCFFEDYIAFSMVILIITVFAIYANTYEEIYNLRRWSIWDIRNPCNEFELGYQSRKTSNENSKNHKIYGSLISS